MRCQRLKADIKWYQTDRYPSKYKTAEVLREVKKQGCQEKCKTKAACGCRFYGTLLFCDDTNGVRGYSFAASCKAESLLGGRFDIYTRIFK